MPDVLTLGDGSTTPRIAWDSVLEGITLTSAATVDDFGALANATDWLPWTFWRPTGGGPYTIEADLVTPHTVTAWAIAGHDAEGLVGMDTWNGSAWVLFAEVIAAGDSAVLYLTGAAVSTTKLRFRFADLSYLGVLYAGEDVILPEGVRPGWSDPRLAQRAVLNPEISRLGVWLGTAVEQWSADQALDLKHVEAAWCRDEWLPFIRRCSTQPFFLHWNATDWPDGATFCTNARFGASPFSSVGFIDVSVSFMSDPGIDRRLQPVDGIPPIIAP